MTCITDSKYGKNEQEQLENIGRGLGGLHLRSRSQTFRQLDGKIGLRHGAFVVEASLQGVQGSAENLDPVGPGHLSGKHPGSQSRGLAAVFGFLFLAQFHDDGGHITEFLRQLFKGLGVCFPAGMRLVRGARAGETPWYWALNGIAGVLCSALAVFFSIYFGISTNLYLACACYLLLLPCLRRMGPDLAEPVAQ